MPPFGPEEVVALLDDESQGARVALAWLRLHGVAPTTLAPGEGGPSGLVLAAATTAATGWLVLPLTRDSEGGPWAQRLLALEDALGGVRLWAPLLAFGRLDVGRLARALET